MNPCDLYKTDMLQEMQDKQISSPAMSDIFKYSIAPKRYVHILDEIKSISKYLSIYKIRFDGKIWIMKLTLMKKCYNITW